MLSAWHCSMSLHPYASFALKKKSMTRMVPDPNAVVADESLLWPVVDGFD